MISLFVGVLAWAEALTFQQALALAREAPAQRTLEQVVEARAALADDVPRLTENPSLTVQPGARARASGGSGPELYLGVSQPFMLSGLGKKRRTSVQRELSADRAEGALTARLLRREVAESWLLRWTAQHAVEETGREHELARTLREQVGAVVAAGEATQVDLAAIRTWEAEAELAELAAEGEAFETGLALARVLGLAAEAPQPVADALPELLLESPEALAAESRAIDAMPSVQAAAAHAAAGEARVAEVGAVRGTRLAIGALGWREGEGDLAAVATLELTAPLFERGQRELASAKAEQARARGQENEARVAARAERALLLHDLEHSARVLQVTEQRLLASAEALAEAQRVRLEAREGTAQEWVLARRAVLRARLDALRARAAHVLARFRVGEAWSRGAPR